MADEKPRRSAPTRARTGSPTPTPPSWRVTPAPDGRGRAPQSPTPPRPNGRWLIIGLVLAVLILNLWVSSSALSPTSRVRVPYSPTFLTQITDGNVQSIDSTNASVQGTFKHPFGYQGSAPTLYFATQIPSFADNQALETVLKDHNVVQNATNPDTGASFLEELLFGFGPTLFLILIIVLFMRRAASGGGGAGGLMSFGRSRARSRARRACRSSRCLRPSSSR